MLAWKAFRIDKNGNLRFLFHTFEGSSLVPVNQWITTKRPWVSDGSCGKKYRSAFHFFPSLQDIEKFKSLTKGKYIIISILVDKSSIEQKPRSSVKSWLAKKIYVPYPNGNVKTKIHPGQEERKPGM